jgi:hypothetical protein
VPCSRCVSKQIVCQSRATRRSSHNPTLQNPLPQPNSERAIHGSAAFQVSQLSQFSSNTPGMNGIPPHSTERHLRSNLANVQADTMSPHTVPPHRLSLPDTHHPVPIAPAMFSQEMDSNMLRNGFTQTPPDMAIPITPMTPNMPQMDNFIQVQGTPFDHEHDHHFLALSSAQTSMVDFDTTNFMTDFRYFRHLG